jgi:hypothetical protein
METNDGTGAGRGAIAGRWQLVYAKRFVSAFGKFESDGSTDDPGANDNGIILSIHLDSSYSYFSGASFFPLVKKIKVVKSQTPLEVVSKRQIAFESKAQADEKAQHTEEYVSILKRSATQLSDARWGFETTSKLMPMDMPRQYF